MDLNLQVKPKGEDELVASYSCPCGCNPRLSYRRGVEHASDGCCCGNEFAVGASAHARLAAPEGFQKELQVFDSPWGERLQAAWTIGPSTDPNNVPEDGHGHGHGHDHAESQAAPDDAEAATGGTATDPVCGMTVDIARARAIGLHSNHLERDWFFCGNGCKVAFDADPAPYLESSRPGSR